MATAGLNGLLEDDFVVIEWDQRGADKSAVGIEPTAAMTLSQLPGSRVGACMSSRREKAG